jgi:hypothetical protein
MKRTKLQLRTQKTMDVKQSKINNMENQQTIDRLNLLIEINNDRIEGYETASKETQETDLRSLFGQLAQTSHACKAELVAAVEEMSGTGQPGLP